MKKFLLVLLALAIPAVALAGPEVYIFNWSEYMPEEVIQRFRKETGIKVVYATYDSNEAMYAKVKLLQAGGYDLVFPSTYYVNRMRREGLLRPVDKSRLANFGNLDSQLLDKPYDPGNAYSVPYLWGTTAIGVNRRHVDPAGITSLEDLWNPAFKGRVLLTDDLREVFALGLRVLGFSGNSTEPAEIEAAYRKLADLMPSVRLFASDSPKQPFLNEEVHIGLLWNGEAFMAAQEDPDIVYIYPREGPVIWMDSMVIPANAKNPEQALAFIDFVLRPEIGELISAEIGYASPNQAAIQRMDPGVRGNPTVSPGAAVLAAGEYQTDVGEAILLYEKYWERLKAGQ